ncbi:MAG: hypothetical protein KDC98_23055 [Planctomycetes bacterium]|nr:hypothetical protein [Planctomycetota bacterium]
MQSKLTRSIPLLLAVFATAGAQAQTATVTYDLVGVMMRPDITYPNTTTSYPMTGSFVWTYTVGDFANGSGQWISHSYSNWVMPLNEIIETNQLEFSMIGNYHGRGFDMTIRFAPDLSPLFPSLVDPSSTYNIENGIPIQGHIYTGSIVPRCPAPEPYGTGSAGSGSITPAIGYSGGLPHIGSTTFAIDGSQVLGGAFSATLMSYQRAVYPIVGIDVLVDPTVTMTVPTFASGPSGVAGAGTTHMPLPLPNLVALVGTGFHFQIIALDAGAPGGIAAASGGLTIQICN